MMTPAAFAEGWRTTHQAARASVEHHDRNAIVMFDPAAAGYQSALDETEGYVAFYASRQSRALEWLRETDGILAACRWRLWSVVVSRVRWRVC